MTKTLEKLIFAIFKLHIFKAFSKINSTNFLIGKTFDDFVIFRKFQEFEIANYFNIL